MLNPLVKDVADSFLEEVETDYWMNTAQFIGIGPGEPAQELHRDNDLWYRVYEWAWPKMPELSFNTLFPFHTVTDEMGATRVIPGSHRWNEKERRPILPKPYRQKWKLVRPSSTPATRFTAVATTGRRTRGAMPCR